MTKTTHKSRTQAAPEPVKIPLPAGMGSVTETGKRSVRVDVSATGNPLRPVGGSETPHFNAAMLDEVVNTIWVPLGEKDGCSARIAAASAALAAFKPGDEIEGMLAAQAVAMHFGALECLRRSMLPGQQADVASKLRRDGANLARGVTDMLAALDRKRGRGPQVVRVERVVVHEGGQAIVGNVQADARADVFQPNGTAPADRSDIRQSGLDMTRVDNLAPEAGLVPANRDSREG